MKKVVSIMFLLGLFAGVTSYAQLTDKAQRKFENSIQHHLDGYLDNLKSNAEELVVADSGALPEIDESLDINPYDENFLYIKRLDSIEQVVPLTHNHFVQQYINIYESRKSFIGDMLSWGKYYFPIFEEALKESEVPLELKYLPVIESSLNPFATSRVGAKGLWQFMHATAKAYGLQINNYVDERKDPELASKAAATYLKEAYEELGDWLLAIASYNCGMGNVRRAIQRAGGVYDFWVIRPYLPRETRNYVPAYIAATYMMQCHHKHGIDQSDKATIYQNAEQIYVSNPVNLNQLSRSLSIDPQTLYTLNPAYSRHVINASSEEPKPIILPANVCLDRNAVFNALNDSQDRSPIHIVDERSSRTYVRSSTKDKLYTITVRHGQSLSTIAQSNGVSLGQLKSWNGLRASNRIYVGQRLKLYANTDSRVVRANTIRAGNKKYYSYKVRKGDTLSEIAQSKGVSVSSLKKINGISSSKNIKPGMVLKVNRM